MSTPTATYDPALPTVRDRIRQLTGDTVVGPDPDSGEERALRPDATIDALIASTSDWRSACAELAEGLAAQFAQDPTSFTATGDMSVSWSDRARTWLDLAGRMRAAVRADEELRARGYRSRRARRADACLAGEFRV